MKNLLQKAFGLKNQFNFNPSKSKKLITRTLRQNIKFYKSSLNSSSQESNLSSLSQNLISKSQSFQKKNLLKNPLFFKDLSKSENSKILWIGCADSRVDPSDILSASPGQISIARTVANQVNLNDQNILSVVEQAVLYQKVEHIIVCGHTNCGGVKASCAASMDGLHPQLVGYLNPIRNLFKKVRGEFKGEEDDFLEVMYKENVFEQVRNLMTVPVVKEAVDKGEVELIPLLFRMNHGVLEEI